MGGSRENRGADRGQATVEFALVLPLLVVCIAGLVWVGNIVMLQIRLEHAAREGARAAAVEPDSASSAATSAVRRSLGDDGAVGVTIDGDYVVVRVSTEVAGVPIIGIGGRTLSAEAHMRREDIND